MKGRCSFEKNAQHHASRDGLRTPPVFPGVSIAACSGSTSGDAADATFEGTSDATADLDSPADDEAPDFAADADSTGDIEVEWSAPLNISATPGMSDIRYQWGRSMASGADGTLHVVWREVEGEIGTLDLARVVYRRHDADGWSATQDITSTLAGTGHLPRVRDDGRPRHGHPSLPENPTGAS